MSKQGGQRTGRDGGDVFTSNVTPDSLPPMEPEGSLSRPRVVGGIKPTRTRFHARVVNAPSREIEVGIASDLPDDALVV